MSSTDQVKTMLREAFSAIPKPSIERAKDIESRGYRDLTRGELWLYFDEHEFRYLLPYLLEDLLDMEGTGVRISTEQSRVLEILNVPSFQGDDLGPDVEKRFREINQEQARAIVLWLELVRKWPEFSGYSFYTRMIDEALAYWRGRSE